MNANYDLVVDVRDDHDALVLDGSAQQQQQQFALPPPFPSASSQCPQVIPVRTSSGQGPFPLPDPLHAWDLPMFPAHEVFAVTASASQMTIGTVVSAIQSERQVVMVNR